MDNSGIFPGILPVYTSGWSAGLISFEEGERFWPAVEKFTSQSSLNDSLDKAMMGGSSPRIWLILHESGNEALSAAAALAFAAELAARGQASLVLDCDHETHALSRWAGRDEAEGWIDLARFGTSVLASSEVLPFEGRRGYLLGAGSFVPADLASQEIADLVARLRRQADDIFLVAPADEVGLMWAATADIRLVCWDRSQGDSPSLAAISQMYSSAGHALTGAVGFGVPDVYAGAGVGRDEVEVVEDRLSEGSLESDVDPVVDFGAGAESAGGDRWQDPSPALRPNAADGGGQGSSRVFWWFAGACVVAIALVGGWYLKYGRVPSGGNIAEVALPNQPVVQMPAPAAETGIDPAAGEAPSGSPDDSTAAVVLAGAVADSAAVTAADEAPGGGRWEEIPTEEVEVAATAADAADQVAAPVAEDPAAATFDMAPYREAVGSRGWALHVYSLPDSAGTAEQVAELDRRGFATTVEVVELAEKGRWWRIYLGSFPSRGAARRAMPPLLEKLRADWAKPVEF
jgi:hypothetical protein